MVPGISLSTSLNSMLSAKWVTLAGETKYKKFPVIMREKKWFILTFHLLAYFTVCGQIEAMGDSKLEVLVLFSCNVYVVLGLNCTYWVYKRSGQFDYRSIHHLVTTALV